jgi:hypothetical protein
MTWLDYCEHCGTTQQPKKVYDVKVKLEGKANSEGDSESIKAKPTNYRWVCSVCNRVVRMKEG